MRLTATVLACAAASAAALTAPPQLQDLKSSLKLKLRKQQLLRATATQNVTTPRRYASVVSPQVRSARGAAGRALRRHRWAEDWAA